MYQRWFDQKTGDWRSTWQCNVSEMIRPQDWRGLSQSIPEMINFVSWSHGQIISSVSLTMQCIKDDLTTGQERPFTKHSRDDLTKRLEKHLTIRSSNAQLVMHNFWSNAKWNRFFRGIGLLAILVNKKRAHGPTSRLRLSLALVMPHYVILWIAFPNKVVDCALCTACIFVTKLVKFYESSCST